jgi:hypothetical protein
MLHVRVGDLLAERIEHREKRLAVEIVPLRHDGDLDGAAAPLPLREDRGRSRHNRQCEDKAQDCSRNISHDRLPILIG